MMKVAVCQQIYVSVSETERIHLSPYCFLDCCTNKEFQNAVMQYMF